MLLRKLMVGLTAASAIGSAHALDVVLAEGFGNVAGLAAAGWVQTNNSVAPLGVPWLQGNPGVFTSAAGAADAYVAASYLSTSASSGAVSNWLMTPVVTLNSASELIFFVRNAGQGFLDRIEARFSSSGASTNVGTTTTSVGDFGMLLKAYQSSDDNGWLGFTYTFSSLAANTTGRVGFRYVVGDVATQGNYLGLDSVVLTGVVPEPATYLLFALGLTGVMLRRRLTN
jgi:hypothetical protein